jgi:hypothetical protein
MILHRTRAIRAISTYMLFGVILEVNVTCQYSK